LYSFYSSSSCIHVHTTTPPRHCADLPLLPLPFPISRHWYWVYFILLGRTSQERGHIKRATRTRLARSGTHYTIHRVALLTLLPLGAHLRVHCNGSLLAGCLPAAEVKRHGEAGVEGNPLLSTKYGIPMKIPILTSPRRIMGLRRIENTETRTC